MVLSGVTTLILSGCLVANVMYNPTLIIPYGASIVLRGQTWAQIDNVSANLTGPRPADGAGCNVPSHFKGYYLGGMAKIRNSSEMKILHSMTVFDMKTEKRG